MKSHLFSQMLFNFEVFASVLCIITQLRAARQPSTYQCTYEREKHLQWEALKLSQQGSFFQQALSN